MREAVTAVFYHRASEKIFMIERQDYLSVFPGYTAFPGGKVDKSDADHHNALKREIKEELNFDLESEDVLNISLLGHAVTPEFNPYRFKVFFYLIELKNEYAFEVDAGEAKASFWKSAKELDLAYEEGRLLAVPPVLSIIELLSEQLYPHWQDDFKPRDFLLPHIEGREVPFIETICGVRQFLPLSNTFPPANRTNSFLLGEKERILVDPSPKNDEELEKFCRSLKKSGTIDAFFISHHHPDHHEFLPQLCERFSKKVYMSEKCHRMITHKWGEDYLKGCEVTFLKEGDFVSDCYGEPLRVYEVPGHDEGQLALAPLNLHWFFVGDLIQTVGTVVVGGEEGDMAKYFESLRRVISLRPKFIIPSHGISIGGVHKLEMTLKHREHREEQIKELLSQKKSEDEILSIIYEGLDESLIRYAQKTIKAHIKKIREESR